MKKSVLMLLLCASGVSFQAAATDSAMKKDYDAANDRASADYQAARKACDGQGGNRKAICIEEAKAQQVRVKSDARAAYIDTPKARVNARKAVADADFDVAREKCKILSGNARDVCVTQAKSTHVATIADANADRKVTAARTEANQEKRTAAFQVEREKCDAMHGTEKSTCIDLAKAKYGK
ncbi:MAG: hypothetical protein ACRYGK_05510 [Janthinobacterium lividum]